MPILTMEFAMGRKSRKSIVCVYDELVPGDNKWKIHSIVVSLIAFYPLQGE